MAYKIKSVLKGSFVYTVGEVLTLASGFFLIPLFTRILTPEDYGIIGYMQFLLQLFTVILLFGFHGAQTRFIYENKETLGDGLGSFLFTINMYLITIMFFVCSLLSLFGEHLYYYISARSIPYYPYFIVTIWTVFFQALNQMVISFNLAKKQYKQTAIMQFVQFSLITLISIFLIMIFNLSALGRLLGILIGQVVFFIFFYLKYVQNFKIKLNLKGLKYALLFGLPIVFHLLAGVLLTSIDRVILENKVSISELGIYTLGYQIGLVMSAITIGFNKAWQPNYYELMKSEDEKLKGYENRRIFAIWLLIIGTICLTGMLWSKEIIIILTPSSFHSSTKIINLVLFSYLINGIYYFVASPLFFYKKTKYLPFITLFSAFVNIALNLLLIPLYGIQGAVYATVISYAVQVINSYLISRIYYNPRYGVISIIFFFIIIGLSDFIKYIDLHIAVLFILKIIYLFVYVFLVLLVYKKYISIDYFHKLIKTWIREKIPININ